MLKYFYGFVLVTAIGIMYEKYRMKYYPDDELNKIGLIKEFLLNDEDLGKPILWIHTTLMTICKKLAKFLFKKHR